MKATKVMSSEHLTKIINYVCDALCKSANTEPLIQKQFSRCSGAADYTKFQKDANHHVMTNYINVVYSIPFEELPIYMAYDTTWEKQNTNYDLEYQYVYARIVSEAVVRYRLFNNE